MLIKKGSRLKVKFVPLKDVYPLSEQGVSLRYAHELELCLQKDKRYYFPPLLCEIDDNGHWGIIDGKHRYIAYVSQGYTKCLVMWVVNASII